MTQLKVVKRNGQLTDFDKTRIENAIKRALNAQEVKLAEEKFDKLIQDITDELHERFTEFYPNVENIQDVVEKHLMHAELYKVAKSYILYRAQRQEDREEQQEEAVKKSYLGKLSVTKRDGTQALIDMKKLHGTVKRAAHGLDISDEQVSTVVKQTVKTLYDGVKTSEIEEALVLTATSFIEKNPQYSMVSSRLMRQKLYKDLMGESIKDEHVAKNYQEVFVKNFEKGLKEGVLHQDMAAYDAQEVAKLLRPERDDLLTYMSIRTLYERYLLRTLDQEVIELPQTFFLRVAMGLALAEPEEDRLAYVKEFYDTMSVLRYLPSTPTLFHSGTHMPQLSSCYLTTVQDDLQHIFKSYSDNAQLSKWSGGIGNDWTNIRATGALIKSTRVESQGVIPFLKIANDVTAAINRSGRRRGATCAYLETWHLDIEDFIDLRKNTGDERRRTHDMNTANWIPDLFMKRVDNDETWTLFSPEEVPELHHLYGRAFEKKYIEYEKKARNGELDKHKVIQAKQLYRKMLSRLFETGHPWFTFKDACNVRSPQDHAGVIHSSNLCTEITLNTSEDETAVCNLGSINLRRHVIDGELDKDLLAETAQRAMRMLDNVVDLCFYPTEEAKNSNLRHRPVGIGVMGFQDMLFAMGVAFDSERALELADSTQEFVAYHAILNSSKLAKEKGVYESYQGSKWERNIFPQDTLELLEQERGVPIETTVEERLDWQAVREHVQQHGMRNSNTMAIAPTATISTISGCYPSIEPIYKNIYVKSNMTGEFTMINEYLVDDLKEAGLWNQETLDQLKYYDGNVSMIAGVPDEIKRKYKEAFQIDPRWALKMTAKRQAWMDQSISHNVFMQGSSGKLLSDIYLTAWKLGVKTTYYLRTLAKSQVEKSTLSAQKYGFTQKRDHENNKAAETQPASAKQAQTVTTTSGGQEVKLCRIEDPDCEACQ